MHLAYLVAIKAISMTKSGKGRTYRLGTAVGPVMSQKEFRVSKGMSEYSYAQKQSVKQREPVVSESNENIDASWFFEEGKKDQKTAEKQPVFLAEAVDKFASEEEIFAPEKANFAHILSNTNTEKTKLEQKLPPKVPPRTSDFAEFENFSPTPSSGTSGSLRDPDDRPNDRPIIAEDGSRRLRDERNDLTISSNGSDGEWSEPLYEKKKIKRPKTEADRRALAKKLADKGHIVNPNGAVDNHKKEVNWKLARDIGPDGKVTMPQLWRHLIKLWDKTFGPGILENMLSTDKSALAMTFENLKQNFIQLCDFEPSNRELAEYFDWFLEPKRLDSILASGKYSDPSNPKTSLHFRQLAGSVFLTRFYQEVILKRRNEAKPVGSGLSKTDMAISVLDQRFTLLRTTHEDNWDFMFSMVQTGYALAAQFLHDEKDLTDSECRQRIIHCMAEFLKRSGNKAKAVKYLTKGIENTEKNKDSLRKETCIWFEWQEKTKDLVEVAIQQSGVIIENEP